jgi:hypothetical protein
LVTRKSGVKQALIAGAAALLLCTAAGCKSSRTNVQNEEQNTAPALLSAVRMSDTAASAQLLKGFYGIEANAWRWTSGNFSVLLKTPPGAAKNGATLIFSFSAPEGSIGKLGKLKLTASANGTQLASAAYTKPGAYMLTADVPASMLSGDTVTIDFELDKTMRVPGDNRDLGLVAASVNLTEK